MMELLFLSSLLVFSSVLVDSRSNFELSNEVTRAGHRRGHWSPWRYWVVCSRTCGGGITFRTRSCLIGDTRVAVENCDGEYKEYAVCNNQPCPGGDVDFRAIQCSMYDELDPYGLVRQWRPINNLNYNCELYCEKHVSSTETLSRNMGVVVDGTSCTESNGPGVCIQGQCRSVGCDGRLDSKLQYDNCGECGGMNRSCGTLSGRFTLELAEEELFHYYDVVTFQPGTTNITVEETNEVNYLALSVHSVYYLNGDWDIDRPGIFSAAGALFTYERRRDGYERLTSPGPTNALVQISIIVRSIDPLVTYQFHLPARPVQSPLSVHREALPNHDNTIVSNTGIIEESGIGNCPCSNHDRGNDSEEESMDSSELSGNTQLGINTHVQKTDIKKKREKKHEQKMIQQMKELCGPCEKAKGKIRNFCSSDFVVRANILDRAIEFNMTRYDVQILQTFTNHVILFSREYIWVPNICNCPKMKTGREYLIMGDRVQSPTSRENLLMVNRDKMVVRWKPAQYDLWDSIQSTSTAKCHKLRNKQKNKRKSVY